MTRLLFREDAYLRRCEATVTQAGERGVRLDQTVFYPAGGGQPGDTGVLHGADGTEMAVVDTVKGEADDEIWHVPTPGTALPVAGSRVTAAIDWERRHRHMRFHTALHLLCAAVPYPVTGGRIAADKAHLDFDLQGATLDRGAVEARLNELVASGAGVAVRWIAAADLDADPALVRTMSVAPPRGQGRVRVLEVSGIDLQACGGTHVSSVAEIGLLAVAKIRSEGRRNKRVTIVFAGEAGGEAT